MKLNMDWYRHLELPDLTPPEWAIEVMWAAFFILNAISALIILNSFPHRGIFVPITVLFIFVFLLTIAWAYTFWWLHILYLAILETCTLALLTVALAAIIWPHSQTASYLLWPGALWASFFSVLTISIKQLNR